jgi:hypothetical protein
MAKVQLFLGLFGKFLFELKIHELISEFSIDCMEKLSKIEISLRPCPKAH